MFFLLHFVALSWDNAYAGSPINAPGRSRPTRQTWPLKKSDQKVIGQIQSTTNGASCCSLFRQEISSYINQLWIEWKLDYWTFLTTLYSDGKFQGILCSNNLGSFEQNGAKQGITVHLAWSWLRNNRTETYFWKYLWLPASIQNRDVLKL